MANINFQPQRSLSTFHFQLSTKELGKHSPVNLKNLACDVT